MTKHGMVIWESIKARQKERRAKEARYTASQAWVVEVYERMRPELEARNAALPSALREPVVHRLAVEPVAWVILYGHAEVLFYAFIAHHMNGIRMQRMTAYRTPTSQGREDAEQEAERWAALVPESWRRLPLPWLGST